MKHAALAPTHTHAQVQSGAFVSSDRDAALARMIDAASVRYSPEQVGNNNQSANHPLALMVSFS